jgi:hypothetical protein
MAFRARRDTKLDRIRTLTGVRSREKLLALGRIGDLVDAAGEPAALSDRYGARHAVGVLAGLCIVPRTGAVHGAGEVFVTERYDDIVSRDAIVLVVPATRAVQLAELLPAPATRTDGHREQLPLFPAARTGASATSA